MEAAEFSLAGDDHLSHRAGGKFRFRVDADAKHGIAFFWLVRIHEKDIQLTFLRPRIVAYSAAVNPSIVISFTTFSALTFIEPPSAGIFHLFIQIH